MDTKKLRQKILDLAIHGKLVPQDSNDKPAIELLKRINPSFEISDNIVNTKLIPSGWCFTKLKDVCVDFIVPQRDKPTRFDGNIPWCRIEDIEGKYLNGSLSNQNVSMDLIKEMNMRICPVGTVLCSCSASIGIQAITTIPCCTNQTFIGIVPSKEVLYEDYLFYFLKSRTKLFNELGTGTTIKYISRTKFEELTIPIPPISEQKRIVTAIEQWFALIDILEKEKSDLQSSIQQAKSKILDLAIHGKLVPQDPNDEPAIELLKRINPEFEDCEHSNNHVIHSGWCVAKLEDVIELLDNKRIPIKSEDREQRVKNKEIVYPYYGATGLVGYIDDYLLDGRYILLGEDGAPFEDKYANVAYEVYGKIWVNNHAHVVSPKISFEYLLYSLNAVDYTLYAKGTTRLKLTQKDMLSIPVSVPPYQEQLRIVTKIEELFAILDSIKESLE